METEFMTRHSMPGYSRFILRRGDETWITAAPWIGDDVVKFDVADSNNCHRRWEFMPKKEFGRIPVHF
jgi:hypothetical protein